jgi:aspartate racemase
VFEARAAACPDAVATVFGNQQLTYGELNERANQLARLLVTLGVGRETPVGVYVERSTEYIISLLAVLKAGGTYVPLDLDYPPQRLQFMLADAVVAVVITRQNAPVELDLRGISLVNLSADAQLIAAGGKKNLRNVAAPESLAYLIYTSGSTGEPKGVAVPHRGVVRLVRGQDYAPFDAHQRFLLLASTSFDASTFELWGALLNGAACVIFPQQPLDFQLLESVIREQGVTCLWLTAGLFNQIVDARPSVLETVPHVLAGGEALSVSHVEKALKRLPQLRLTNGYGPTESTTFACTYRIEPGSTFPTGSVPIGRPLAHTYCYLLDEQLKPVPAGTPGELYLGGDGLARGYHNRPELTAEKFIADPYRSQPGASLYKTGDLARYLPDGNLEFLGRIDQQVKIRGYRIELGEIETALAKHPDVLKVVVLAREDVPHHRNLVAYVVSRKESAVTAVQLRDFLGLKLPAYMIPVAFVALPDLPLTPNGKIDRNALPAPRLPAEETSAKPASPATTLEQEVAGVWGKVLQRPVSGLDHNFFEAGGDSLRLASLHVHLQQLLGRKFPITDLFLYTTIRALAAHFNSSQKSATPSDPGRLRAEQQRQAFSAQSRTRRLTK